MHIFCVSLDRRKGDLLPTHHMFTPILNLRILNFKKSSVSFDLLKIGFCFVIKINKNCRYKPSFLPKKSIFFTKKQWQIDNSWFVDSVLVKTCNEHIKSAIGCRVDCINEKNLTASCYYFYRFDGYSRLY